MFLLYLEEKDSSLEVRSGLVFNKTNEDVYILPLSERLFRVMSYLTTYLKTEFTST